MPWTLLLLDLAAAPGLYSLWRDVRGGLADAALQTCVGDCDRDGVVGEGELLTGIAIALDDVSVEICEAFDIVDEPGVVTVDELVQAVRDALGPCRYATTTPTLTVTPLATPFAPQPRPRTTPRPP